MKHLSERVIAMHEFEQKAHRSGWRPPSGIFTHLGEPIPVKMDFFAQPPKEIGELVSVYSTLQMDKEPLGAIVRLVLAFIPAFLIWLFISLAFLKASGALVLANVIGGGAGLLALLPVYYFTRFEHTCSFVGKLGIARYTIRRSRDVIPTTELLEFRNAAALYTGQTQSYSHGMYSGTQYFFHWMDRSGDRLFKLAGTHFSKEGKPPAKNPYHFACAGEVAWSEYLLNTLAAELEKKGAIEFRVNKSDAVRVGPGFMEFAFGGNRERVEGEALKQISIIDGVFLFKSSEANWYSGKGKFKFSYGSMANARLFVLALHSLLGVRID